MAIIAVTVIAGAAGIVAGAVLALIALARLASAWTRVVF